MLVRKHLWIFIALTIVSLVASEVKAQSQTITYTMRSANLEFSIEALYQVQVGQTFQLKIKVTNKAVSTVYLRLTWIEVVGNGIGYDGKIYISQSTDLGDSYTADAVIYENTHTYTVDKNKFSSYIPPLIYVNILYNSYTTPDKPYANPDFGYVNSFTISVREKDWESEYNTLKNDYDGLKSNYDSLQLDMGNLRNLLYIFILTTLAFMGTTVFFAVRKPKTKSL